MHLDVPAHNYQSMVEGWETHYWGHGGVISPADGAAVGALMQRSANDANGQFDQFPRTRLSARYVFG